MTLMIRNWHLTITGATSRAASSASWQQLGSDIDGEARDDTSGIISLSADGSTIAIGATANYGNGRDSGHVRIYQRNSNGNWEQAGADIDGEALKTVLDQRLCLR